MTPWFKSLDTLMWMPNAVVCKSAEYCVQMQPHGIFVWSAWLLTFLVIIVLAVHARHQRQQLVNTLFQYQQQRKRSLPVQEKSLSNT